MRLLLIVFITVMMINDLCAQQGISKTTSVYNEEGKLQMLISYNPSCSCRTYTEFYPDGKIYARRTFKVVAKGEFIDGEDVTYYHDGSIKQYKFWKNAVPEGRAYASYENGKPEHEEFYKAKYKVGTWRYYDKNGALMREQLFDGMSNSWNSKKNDVIIKYYNAGKLLYTEVYKDGKLVQSDKKETKIIAAAVRASHTAELVDGKKLFALKCAACHSFDKDGYGPSLKAVTKRRNDVWLYKMITNGMQLVDKGDKDAIALYNQYNKKKHLNMEYLTNQQVQAIINYMRNPQ